MEGRNITQKERSCIADCIQSHWGESQKSRDIDERDRSYEECLSSCEICS